MNGIKLIATGSALPGRAVTNDELTKIVDTSDEWISTRTGIRSRRWCAEGESHTSLCLAAARQALERAGAEPAEIGVCLVATLTLRLPHPRRRLRAPEGAGPAGGHGVL